MFFHSNFFLQKSSKSLEENKCFFQAIQSLLSPTFCWPLLCNNRTAFYSHLFASLYESASSSQKKDAKSSEYPTANTFISKCSSMLLGDSHVHPPESRSSPKPCQARKCKGETRGNTKDESTFSV